MGNEMHGLGHRQLLAEADLLRRSGSRVALLLPDAATQAGFGISMMDRTRMGPAAEAGLRQAGDAAAAIAAIWH